MGLRRVAEPAGITRSIVQMFVSAGKGDGDECRSRHAVRPRAASLPHSLGRWMGCGLAALSQIALALVYDARRRPAADDRERLPRSLPAGLRNLLPTDFDREADKVKALSELELAALTPGPARGFAPVLGVPRGDGPADRRGDRAPLARRRPRRPLALDCSTPTFPSRPSSRWWATDGQREPPKPAETPTSPRWQKSRSKAGFPGLPKPAETPSGYS
jgi:hypothetical protein